MNMKNNGNKIIVTLLDGTEVDVDVVIEYGVLKNQVPY